METSIAMTVIFLVIVFIIGCEPQGQGRDKEFVGFYSSDSALMNRLETLLRNKDIDFYVQERSDDGIYLNFERKHKLQVKKAVASLKESTQAVKYTGLCESDTEKRDRLASSLLAAKIGHMIEKSDLGYCVYWAMNDSLKVMELSETYKSIVESRNQ